MSVITWPWRFYRKPRSLGRRIWWRSLWTFVATFTAIGTAFAYRESILLWFIAPAGDRLSPFEDNLPVFTEPTGMLGVVVKMAVFGGLFGAIPALTISGYTLVSPALSRRQRLWVQAFAVLAVLFFAAGVAFVYFVILPNGLRFLLNFGGDVATPLISVTDYMNLVLALMFWMGFFFEMPLVMFMSAKLNVISYQRFKSLQKLIPWVLLVFAVIITPGFDIVNALLVWIPLWALYQAGLFASWLAHPEEGNYLFIKTIRSCVTGGLRKLRAIVKLPVVVIRRVYGKIKSL